MHEHKSGQLNNSEIAGDLHWYAIHTKPRQERVAEAKLKSLGLTTFLPQVTGQPYLPSYVFVQCDIVTTGTNNLRFGESLASRGGLVMYGDKPAVVPDKTIEDLKVKMANPGVLDIKRNPLKLGDTVFIIGNELLSGISGTIQSFHGNNVEVILDTPSQAKIKVNSKLLRRL